MSRRLDSHRLVQAIADEVNGGDVLAAIDEAVMDSVNPGACRQCGAVHYDSCEPDMRDGPCDECGSAQVASILVLAGIM